jgi:hypothetical protein
MSKTVTRYFQEDLAKYIKQNNIQVMVGGIEKDVWFCTGSEVVTSEARMLNKLLGIHSINYQGNQNGIKNKC